MRISYTTEGSCATRIDIDVVDGIVIQANFIDGCPGNTQAVASLVRGMQVAKVVQHLKGIPCRGETSCPDQLARALELHLKERSHEAHCGQ